MERTSTIGAVSEMGEEEEEEEEYVGPRIQKSKIVAGHWGNYYEADFVDEIVQNEFNRSIDDGSLLEAGT